MDNKIEINQTGIGFAGALTILLDALRILGYIDWTWLQVFSPLLIVQAVRVVILTALSVTARSRWR